MWRTNKALTKQKIPDYFQLDNENLWKAFELLKQR